MTILEGEKGNAGFERIDGGVDSEARLDDDAWRIQGRIRLTERGDHAVAMPFGRTEVDEEDLVLTVMDQFTKGVPALGEVDGSELAFKDRKLQVIAVVAHGPKNAPKPLVVAHVIANEVGVAHGGAFGGTFKEVK